MTLTKWTFALLILFGLNLVANAQDQAKDQDGLPVYSNTDLHYTTYSFGSNQIVAVGEGDAAAIRCRLSGLPWNRKYAADLVYANGEHERLFSGYHRQVNQVNALPDVKASPFVSFEASAANTICSNPNGNYTFRIIDSGTKDDDGNEIFLATLVPQIAAKAP